MTLSRRTFGLGIGALALSACGGPTTVARGPAAPEALPDDLRPVPDAGYDAWVAAFRPRAASRGIADGTLASAFRSAGFLPGAITRDRSQPESQRTLEDYLSIAVSDERVAKGRAAFAANRATLAGGAVPLRRRPDRRHRDLGPRELLRRAPRRRPGGLLDLDPRLRGPPRRLLRGAAPRRPPHPRRTATPPPSA